MSANREADLGDILRAVREVEANLERRAARANGAVSMIWGAFASLIFLFYHLITYNHAAWHALLGGFLAWVWVPPTVLGYVATAMVGARAGRIGGGGEAAARTTLVVSLALLVPIAVTVAAIFGVAGLGFGNIPGMWVAFLGILKLALTPRDASDRAVHVGFGALALVAGLALAVLAPPWANLAAAVIYVVGLVGGGVLIYRRGSP